MYDAQLWSFLTEIFYSVPKRRFIKCNEVVSCCQSKIVEQIRYCTGVINTITTLLVSETGSAI